MRVCHWRMLTVRARLRKYVPNSMSPRFTLFTVPSASLKGEALPTAFWVEFSNKSTLALAPVGKSVRNAARPAAVGVVNCNLPIEAEPILLIRAEEECAVLADRAANRPGIGILNPKRLMPARCDVGVARLRTGDGVVARRIQLIRQRAVKTICAGFRDRVDDRAARASELGVEVGGLDGHFLHGIRVSDLEALPRNGDVVVFRAINQKVVRATAPAVDRKRADTKAAAIAGHTGQRQRQTDGIAIANRQLRDDLRLNVATAHRRFGLQQCAVFSRDVHSHFLCAGRQAGIYLRDLIGADIKVVFEDGSKIRGSDLDGIIAQLDGIEAIQAFAIGDGGAHDARLIIGERDRCTRDDSAGSVAGQTADRAATGLGDNRQAEP